MQTLTSQEDLSVNFVLPSGFEARYVRRSPHYAIVYLSSHTGCNQACRFCHLTQTKQTGMIAATVQDFLVQARLVLDHYIGEVSEGKQERVNALHFNWMARGEALLNMNLFTYWEEISQSLRKLAQDVGVDEVRFNVSTIMPEKGWDIKKIKGSMAPTIFYSLYSTDTSFRKRWLPKAMHVSSALRDLKVHQLQGGDVVIHHALIEGENDSLHAAEDIGKEIRHNRLRTRFNLVRYNPYSEVQGREPPEPQVNRYFRTLVAYMDLPGSRIVPRVGKDVFASCGMFINLKSAA